MHSIAEFYKKKKFLITGAAGFKEAWLFTWLLCLGSEITNEQIQKIYETLIGFNFKWKQI